MNRPPNDRCGCVFVGWPENAPPATIDSLIKSRLSQDHQFPHAQSAYHKYRSDDVLLMLKGIRPKPYVRTASHANHRVTEFMHRLVVDLFVDNDQGSKACDALLRVELKNIMGADRALMPFETVVVLRKGSTLRPVVARYEVDLPVDVKGRVIGLLAERPINNLSLVNAGGTPEAAVIYERRESFGSDSRTLGPPVDISGYPRQTSGSVRPLPSEQSRRGSSDSMRSPIDPIDPATGSPALIPNARSRAPSGTFGRPVAPNIGSLIGPRKLSYPPRDGTAYDHPDPLSRRPSASYRSPDVPMSLSPVARTSPAVWGPPVLPRRDDEERSGPASWDRNQEQQQLPPDNGYLRYQKYYYGTAPARWDQRGQEPRRRSPDYSVGSQAWEAERMPHSAHPRHPSIPGGPQAEILIPNARTVNACGSSREHGSMSSNASTSSAPRYDSGGPLIGPRAGVVPRSTAGTPQSGAPAPPPLLIPRVGVLPRYGPEPPPQPSGPQATIVPGPNAILKTPMEARQAPQPLIGPRSAKELAEIKSRAPELPFISDGSSDRVYGPNISPGRMAQHLPRQASAAQPVTQVPPPLPHPVSQVPSKNGASQQIDTAPDPDELRCACYFRDPPDETLIINTREALEKPGANPPHRIKHTPYGYHAIPLIQLPNQPPNLSLGSRQDWRGIAKDPGTIRAIIDLVLTDERAAKHGSASEERLRDEFFKMDIHLKQAWRKDSIELQYPSWRHLSRFEINIQASRVPVFIAALGSGNHDNLQLIWLQSFAEGQAAAVAQAQALEAKAQAKVAYEALRLEAEVKREAEAVASLAASNQQRVSESQASPSVPKEDITPGLAVHPLSRPFARSDHSMFADDGTYKRPASWARLVKIVVDCELPRKSNDTTRPHGSMGRFRQALSALAITFVQDVTEAGQALEIPNGWLLRYELELSNEQLPPLLAAIGGRAVTSIYLVWAPTYAEHVMPTDKATSHVKQDKDASVVTDEEEEEDLELLVVSHVEEPPKTAAQSSVEPVTTDVDMTPPEDSRASSVGPINPVIDLTADSVPNPEQSPSYPDRELLEESETSAVPPAGRKASEQITTSRQQGEGTTIFEGSGQANATLRPSPEVKPPSLSLPSLPAKDGPLTSLKLKAVDTSLFAAAGSPASPSVVPETRLPSPTSPRAVPNVAVRTAAGDQAMRLPSSPNGAGADAGQMQAATADVDMDQGNDSSVEGADAGERKSRRKSDKSSKSEPDYYLIGTAKYTLTPATLKPSEKDWDPAEEKDITTWFRGAYKRRQQQLENQAAMAAGTFPRGRHFSGSLDLNQPTYLGKHRAVGRPPKPREPILQDFSYPMSVPLGPTQLIPPLTMSMRTYAPILNNGKLQPLTTLGKGSVVLGTCRKLFRRYKLEMCHGCDTKQRCSRKDMWKLPESTNMDGDTLDDPMPVGGEPLTRMPMPALGPRFYGTAGNGQPLSNEEALAISAIPNGDLSRPPLPPGHSGPLMTFAPLHHPPDQHYPHQRLPVVEDPFRPPYRPPVGTLSAVARPPQPSGPQTGDKRPASPTGA